MAGTHRSEDQKVEAFSLPLDLFKRAMSRAADKSMTKSGYYRYCLAKDLGLTEEEALAISRDVRMEKANAALRQQRITATRPEKQSDLPNSNLDCARAVSPDAAMASMLNESYPSAPLIPTSTPISYKRLRAAGNRKRKGSPPPAPTQDLK